MRLACHQVRGRGKAFPSLQPHPDEPGRGFRYPFQRGTPPQRPRVIALAFAAILSSLAAGAGAGVPQDAGTGPITATVRYVVDGDTIRVEPITWSDGRVFQWIRFERFSAPELGHRAACGEEAALGLRAKQALAEIIRPGDRVRLLRARPGRYRQRLIADVRTWNDLDPGPFLIAKKLAVPYNPGERPRWCGQ